MIYLYIFNFRNNILTAAHCCDGMTPSDWKILVGAHDISVQEDTTQLIKVKEIVMHEGYSLSQPYITSDICIIKLQEPAQLNMLVDPL